jgi:transposase InsO family protein
LGKVNRQLHAPAPNVLWVSDFTYVATWQGVVRAVSIDLSVGVTLVGPFILANP